MRARALLLLLAAFVSLGVAGCGGGGSVAPATTFEAFHTTIAPTQVIDQVLQGLSLGLDFDVGSRSIQVTAVGVFDWQEDGLESDHTVTIFDRDGTPIVQTTIQVGEGYMVDGFRYVDLDTAVRLPAGFNGTIAIGYPADNLDRNGNTHGELEVDPAPLFDDGDFLIENVGSGRYGLDPDGFPDTPDGSPANRYHAGSFRFSR